MLPFLIYINDDIPYDAFLVDVCCAHNLRVICTAAAPHDGHLPGFEPAETKPTAGAGFVIY